MPEVNGDRRGREQALAMAYKNGSADTFESVTDLGELTELMRCLNLPLSDCQTAADMKDRVRQYVQSNRKRVKHAQVSLSHPHLSCRYRVYVRSATSGTKLCIPVSLCLPYSDLLYVLALYKKVA